jgi:hypothetical protein
MRTRAQYDSGDDSDLDDPIFRWGLRLSATDPLVGDAAFTELIENVIIAATGEITPFRQNQSNTD